MRLTARNHQQMPPLNAESASAAKICPTSSPGSGAGAASRAARNARKEDPNVRRHACPHAAAEGPSPEGHATADHRADVHGGRLLRAGLPARPAFSTAPGPDPEPVTRPRRRRTRTSDSPPPQPFPGGSRVHSRGSNNAAVKVLDPARRPKTVPEGAAAGAGRRRGQVSGRYAQPVGGRCRPASPAACQDRSSADRRTRPGP
jgi:hypothetical protein